MTLVAALAILAASVASADEFRSSATSTGAQKKTVAIASPPPRVAAELLRLHNYVRKQDGLPPLRMGTKLASAAQKFSAYLARRRNYGHEADGRTPNQRVEAEGYEWGTWAENIAWGMRRPQDAVMVWMQSEGHRKNIMSEHAEIGFGITDDVWVAVFGTPLDEYIEIERAKQRQAATK